MCKIWKDSTNPNPYFLAMLPTHAYWLFYLLIMCRYVDIRHHCKYGLKHCQLITSFIFLHVGVKDNFNSSFNKEPSIVRDVFILTPTYQELKISVLYTNKQLIWEIKISCALIKNRKWKEFLWSFYKCARKIGTEHCCFIYSLLLKPTCMRKLASARFILPVHH